MTKATRRYLLAAMIALGSIASANAQSTGIRVATDQKSSTDMGGSATSGTGVKTGKGPLNQPIAPAASTMNPQQNPQRPQNMQGPASTNPPEHPFGNR